MINRKFFFDYVRSRLFNGTMSKSQMDGLHLFLDYWDSQNRLTDTRWLAYILATTHHETDHKFQPIEEYGKGKGRVYGQPDPQTGQTYYGRGYVQLTWKYNYAKMGQVLGITDLENKPALALQPDIALQIIFYGMEHGSFTGKRLGSYFSGTTEKWVDARRIINGVDKANTIALFARAFYAAINVI